MSKNSTAISKINSRLTELLFSKRWVWVWVCIGILLIWKCVIFYYLPYANQDGPHSLGQTFSLLRGNLFSAPLGNSHIDPYLYPYFYAIVSAPAFLLLPFGAYNIFVWNLILALAGCALVLSLVDRQNHLSLSVAFVLILGFLCNMYTYGLRNELPTTVVMLVLLKIILWNPTPRLNFFRLVIIGVVTAIIGLMHPVAGVITVGLLLMMLHDYKASLIDILTIGATTFLALLLLYLPVVLIDFDKWRYTFFVIGMEQDEHSFSWSSCIKYVKYAPIVFVPPLIAIVEKWRRSGLKSSWWIKETIYWVLMIGLLSLFGRSYYFPYLIVFIAWRLLRLPNFTIPALALLVVLIVSPILTHYLPTFQLIENPKYSQTLHHIISEVEKYRDKADTDLVYVNPRVVMPIMDRPKARIFFRFYRTVAQKGMDFSGDDIFLYINPDDYKLIIRNLDVPEENLIVTELISPTPGLLRPGTFFRERDAPLGLWKIELLEP